MTDTPTRQPARCLDGHPAETIPCRRCAQEKRRATAEDIARCRDALDTARREQREQAARRATP